MLCSAWPAAKRLRLRKAMTGKQNLNSHSPKTANPDPESAILNVYLKIRD